MKLTISAFKADVGSIGGHIIPSQALMETVKKFVSSQNFIIDHRITFTGDDVAILLTHEKGTDSEEIHEMAWNAFMEGAKKAEEQGLYGAGQDLLADAFSGNVKGMGPAVAEMEIEERKNEPFVFFAADKTDPGCYNLPLYLGFADPMHCSGLMLSPNMAAGFVFTIVDVEYTECQKCHKFHLKGQSCDQGSDKKGDRIIRLATPENLYDIAALLRDQERFVVESIHTRDGDQASSVSTTRLHNIAGKYTGKDDPICLIRVQGSFPATGEILSPYRIGHYVAGFMRGSHHGPLMPVKQNQSISFFDGPPIVSGAAYSVNQGKLTEAADVFDHPFWGHVRDKVSRKAINIREQGFFGPAMLPYSELEYGGIVDKMEELDDKFEVREE